MIGASRDINRAFAAVHDREIARERTPYGLRGKTACVVGLGAIGHEIVARLHPFGMRLIGCDDHPESGPDGVTMFAANRLHEAVADADYVLVCAPGGAETEKLIDGAVFDAMKPGAIIVNVARGTLVDEAASRDAVASGRLAAAGLDVLAVEPADPKNPLLAMLDVVITPHVAGQTDVTIEGTVAFLATVVDAFSEGRKFPSLLNTPESPRRALT
jgi:phosphoglycerate dehydrogenase-like enzyme